MLQLTAQQIGEIKRQLKYDCHSNRPYNRKVCCRVQDWRCFWCEREITDACHRATGYDQPDYAATIEHLRLPHDAELIKSLFGLRIVAACRRCNHLRGELKHNKLKG